MRRTPLTIAVLVLTLLFSQWLDVVHHHRKDARHAQSSCPICLHAHNMQSVAPASITPPAAVKAHFTPPRTRETAQTPAPIIHQRARAPPASSTPLQSA
jgi:hypothetical protein